MTSSHQRDPDFDHARDPTGRPRLSASVDPVAWLRRRQDKVRDGIARANRGDHLIPTWALLALNVVIIAGCLLGLLLT